MDHLTAEQRSENMRRIRSANTRPELAVRSALHRLGYRFRLHASQLPGKPDIVLPKYKTVVFVHGCFWHRHRCKKGNRHPRSNTDYWDAKLKKNVARDASNRRQLRLRGWRCITIWECQTKEQVKLADELRQAIDASG